MQLSVTNNEFSKSLGNALNRPSLLRMPEFVLRLLFGEMADLLVFGQAVLPKAMNDAGFKFQYPELKPALENVLSGR